MRLSCQLALGVPVEQDESEGREDCPIVESSLQAIIFHHHPTTPMRFHAAPFPLIAVQVFTILLPLPLQTSTTSVSTATIHLSLSCHASSKKSAALTPPGASRDGATVTSMIAQSGKCGFCNELLWSWPSRLVMPEFKTT